MICCIHHGVRDQHLVSLFAYVAKSCHQRLPNRLTIRILFIFCEAADPIWSCDLRLRSKSLFDDRNSPWLLIPRGLDAMPCRIRGADEKALRWPIIDYKINRRISPIAIGEQA